MTTTPSTKAAALESVRAATQRLEDAQTEYYNAATARGLLLAHLHESKVATLAELGQAAGITQVPNVCRVIAKAKASAALERRGGDNSEC